MLLRDRWEALLSGHLGVLGTVAAFTEGLPWLDAVQAQLDQRVRQPEHQRGRHCRNHPRVVGAFDAAAGAEPVSPSRRRAERRRSHIRFRFGQARSPRLLANIRSNRSNRNLAALGGIAEAQSSGATRSGSNPPH